LIAAGLGVSSFERRLFVRREVPSRETATGERGR